MELLHQFKFTIRRHEADSLLRIEPRQVYTLVKSHIIKFDRLPTKKEKQRKLIIKKLLDHEALLVTY